MQSQETRQFIAQVASAAAVVISLVFVGLEVRESALQTALNTQAAHVGAYQQLIERIAEMNQQNIDNPELLQLIISGRSLRELSSEEQTRVLNHLMTRIRFADLAFYQVELGMLSENRLASVMGPLRGIMGCRITRDVWALVEENFVSGYRDYVESNLMLEPCRERY